MFAKETYVQRRAQLKKTIGSGVLLFLGNDEQGLNYEDNTFRYRQDSTFLYYFGLSFAGLSALIDIDEDKEIIFGDELTIDHIVWMGTQPTLHEKASAVGISETRPFADIVGYLHKAVQKGQTIHYLPPYRAEHKLKLMDWLGVPPARQEGSVPFIRAVVAQRNYKSAEEIAEIEKGTLSYSAQAEQKHRQPLTKRRKFFILIIVVQILREVANCHKNKYCTDPKKDPFATAKSQGEKSGSQKQ